MEVVNSASSNTETFASYMALRLYHADYPNLNERKPWEDRSEEFRETYRVIGRRMLKAILDDGYQIVKV